MINPSTPITGATVTGFTAPTYTITPDTAPNASSKQWAVTAIGGTQTGVDLHATSKPFTITVFKVASPKTLPSASASTGVIVGSIPVNKFRILVRKGAVPAANNAAIVNSAELIIRVGAGTDTYEPEDVKAMLSAMIGFLSSNSVGIGDTLLNNVL